MPKLFVVALLLLSSPIFGQRMAIGPEVGMNMIQIEQQDIGNDFQPGWYAGVAYDYLFNDALSIRTGFYYSQGRKAYSSADTSQSDILSVFTDTATFQGIDLNTYSTTSGRSTQHYLQLPIMACYSYEGFNVFAGGYLGFLFGAQQKELTIERTPFMSTIDIDALDPTGFISAFLPPAYSETISESSDKENIRVFDYGLKGGIGYQHDRLGFQVNYTFGLPDYRKNAENESNERNQFLQFSVRYLLPIAQKTGTSSIR